MNSVQRQFGKLMNKGAGDSSKVAVLLKEFEDADQMLTTVIEASRSWKDSWVSLLSIQLGTLTSFEELYNPIIGASDGHGQDPVLTPPLQLDRICKLRVTYSELKSELMEEVNTMDTRIIKPATDAKDYIQPVRKTIKKRENKRLDFERYTDRVNHASKKLKRSDRENAALAKAEEELAKAEDEFKVADNHLRETLPPLITSAFSILPHLLAAQIMIQNTLLAQYYTILHNYCDDVGFPSPPPPMDEVVAVWSRSFKTIQTEVESINCIARGKAVHQSMVIGENGSGRKSSSVTGLNIRNGIANRRTSSQGKLTPGSPSPNMEARIGRIPSSNSIAVVTPPAAQPSPSPEPAPVYTTPDYSSHLSPVSSHSGHSPAGSGMDYFQRHNPGAAQKKKPPPPPPKRIGSQNSGLFVIALYAFEGQGVGDLSFNEGDRIKVLKKTESTDDWWEGEIRGAKGSFPANYCKNA